MAKNDSLDRVMGAPPVLLQAIQELIRSARYKVLRAVDSVQVQTYWEIGRHIVEFEQAGETRAEYGKRLLETLASSLQKEFGKGFDTTNLRHMRAFYTAFPNRDALRPELSWTHYRTLLKVETDRARVWYMNEAADQNWATRALERQINSLYHERLLASRDKVAVAGEAGQAIADLDRPKERPREFVRDPVVLEFLGFSENEKFLEADFEKALLGNLQSFLLELGRGFAFVGRQYRLSTETKDFYVDLVFYNYILKCFVLFDIKVGELTHQDIGQMDMYVRMMDELKRGKDDNPTVGIILCSYKDESVVRYSVLHENEQIFASKYRLVLPSEEELRSEMDRELEMLKAQ